MPTQLLIRSVKECLDAGAFLQEQRERGEAVERALKRVNCARAELWEQVEATQDPSVKAAEVVIREAPCPVLTVGREPERFVGQLHRKSDEVLLTQP